MKEYRFIQVDVFTDKPFGGNPLAVFPEAEGLTSEDMQSLAREMNLSETAFLHREITGKTERDTVYRLRWFTPATEVDLCGHATLASAHVLWQEGHLKPGERPRFGTKSGRLTAWQDGEWIAMDFPAEAAEEAPAPADVVQALGVTPVFTGKNRFDWLMEVASEGLLLLSLSEDELALLEKFMVMLVSPSPWPVWT